MRVTTWPDCPLPALAVPRFEVGLIEEGWLRLATLPSRPVPAELYARELTDLGLGSEDEISAFVGEYGWLGTPGDWSDVFDLREERPRAISALVDERARRAAAFFDDWRQAAVDAGDWESACAIDPEWEDQARSLAHLDEFRMRAQLLRDMHRVWLACTENISFEDVAYQWESRWLWMNAPGSTEDALARFLVPRLNRGLHGVSIRLEIDAPQPEDPLNELVGAPNLYTALCMQLWQSIQGQSEWRRCANESCGRWISTKRTSNGQHSRSGVKYCDEYCANAERQRRWRKRGKGGAE